MQKWTFVPWLLSMFVVCILSLSKNLWECPEWSVHSNCEEISKNLQISNIMKTPTFHAFQKFGYFALELCPHDFTKDVDFVEKPALSSNYRYLLKYTLSRVNFPYEKRTLVQHFNTSNAFILYRSEVESLVFSRKKSWSVFVNTNFMLYFSAILKQNMTLYIRC